MDSCGGKVMKTLVLILHYNTLELTNSLYESLSKYKSNDYDLFILNNGSDKENESSYPSLNTGRNLYFGGGLDWAFKYMLKNKQYDSLLFLNSDLKIQGENFVTLLRNELFDNKLKMVSYSVEEDFAKADAIWSQMAKQTEHECRIVEWIDFQCPLIHRDVIEHIKEFSSKINIGFGHHYVCAFACEEKNWKIGVSDKKTVNHLGTSTASVVFGDSSSYTRKATKQVIRYFRTYKNGKYRLKRKQWERLYSQ